MSGVKKRGINILKKSYKASKSDKDKTQSPSAKRRKTDHSEVNNDSDVEFVAQSRPPPIIIIDDVIDGYEPLQLVPVPRPRPLRPKPTPLPKIRTYDPESKTSDPKIATSDPKDKNPETKTKTSDPKIRTYDPKIKTSNPKIRRSTPLTKTSSPKIKTSDPKIETSVSKTRPYEAKRPIFQKKRPKFLETTMAISTKFEQPIVLPAPSLANQATKDTQILSNSLGSNVFLVQGEGTNNFYLVSNNDFLSSNNVLSSIIAPAPVLNGGSLAQALVAAKYPSHDNDPVMFSSVSASIESTNSDHSYISATTQASTDAKTCASTVATASGNVSSTLNSTPTVDSVTTTTVPLSSAPIAPIVAMVTTTSGNAATTESLNSPIVATTSENAATTVSLSSSPIVATVTTTSENAATTVPLSSSPMVATVTTTSGNAATTVSLSSSPIVSTVTTSSENAATTVSLSPSPIVATVTTTSGNASTTVSLSSPIVATPSKETTCEVTSSQSVISVSNTTSNITRKPKVTGQEKGVTVGKPIGGGKTPSRVVNNMKVAIRKAIGTGTPQDPIDLTDSGGKPSSSIHMKTATPKPTVTGSSQDSIALTDCGPTAGATTDASEPPLPKNVKIDFSNRTILLDDRVHKITCFTQTEDGKVKVNIAASKDTPKRTVILKKIPPNFSSVVNNVAKFVHVTPGAPEPSSTPVAAGTSRPSLTRIAPAPSTPVARIAPASSTPVVPRIAPAPSTPVAPRIALASSTPVPRMIVPGPSSMTKLLGNALNPGASKLPSLTITKSSVTQPILTERKFINVGGKRYEYTDKVPQIKPKVTPKQKPVKPASQFVYVGGNKYEYVAKTKAQPKQTISKEHTLQTQKVLDELSKAMDLEIDSNSSTSSGSVQYTKKCKHGMRWTEKDKLTAVALYRYSPRRYRSLQAIFDLPSRKISFQTLTLAKFGNGVNQKVFSLIENILASFNVKEKLFAVTFNIAAFKGVNKVTEYALVFMLKSLHKNWEQPVAIFTSTQNFTQEEIAEDVKAVVSACLSVNQLNVECVACDVKYAKALNILGSTDSKPFFVINGKNVLTIFDCKSLLVNIRNTFYKYNLKCRPPEAEEEQVASWQHIKQVVQMDKISTYQLIQGVDDSYLEPAKNDSASFLKSRKVLSYKIGSCINSYVSSGSLDASAMATGHFVVKMNEIFDSLLGKSERPKGLQGLKSFLQTSRERLHLDAWSAALKDIKTWKFINGRKVILPHSIKALKTTLNALPMLWEDVKKAGIKSLNLTKLSIQSADRFVSEACKKNPRRKNVSVFPALTSRLKDVLELNTINTIGLQSESDSPNDKIYKVLHQFISSESFYENITISHLAKGKNQDSSDESEIDY